MRRFGIRAQNGIDQMNIGKIRIGELDARNTALANKRRNLDIWENSFVNPPNLNLADFFDGSKFFIYGMKGSGKTELVWYLHQSFLKQGHISEVILFKSDLTEEERQKIILLRDAIFIEDQKKIEVEYDYKISWLWFIYKNIIQQIEKFSAKSGNDYLFDLVRIFGVAQSKKESIFQRLQFRQIKAQAKAGLEAGPFKTEIGIEVEAILKEKIKDNIDVLKIIQIAEHFLPKIILDEKKKTSIFFDELELFYDKPDQKDRDLRLIRDLLYAVSRANRVFINEGAQFFCYASVRAEVLSEINTIGPEIQREIEDFGIQVSWEAGTDINSHPLLKIAEQRIRSSEIEEGIIPTNDIWDKYFEAEMFGKLTRQYLLDASMLRPRNLIRILKYAQEFSPDSEIFSNTCFENTRTRFSSGVYSEVDEELRVSLSPDQAAIVKDALTGFRRYFTENEFQERISGIISRKKKFSKELLDFPHVRDILRLLYRIGAIGNHFKITVAGKRLPRDRWIFRNFPAPSFENEFVVHEALHKALQLR